MSGETGCGCYGGCAPSLTTDPAKRVHYAQGLVLGVDEFVQAEYYFLEGARRHARTLHGYGTICGLGVSARDVEAGVEIRVEPGHAIDTNGREIRVDGAQCAQLSDWLGTQATADPPLEIPTPPQIDLWVTLCYRECLTDLEPIPGAPCRTPDEATVATRVTETFALRFERDRPAMRAFDAIRLFARLLRRIRAVGDGADVIDIGELEALVVSLAEGEPDIDADATLDVPEDTAQDYLDAAFRAWVTQVRPGLVPEGSGCADGPGGDCCIALARIRVPVVSDGDGGIAVDGTAEAIEVEQADRPLLLPTQLLQELLLLGGGGVTDHAALGNLDADDHGQYLLVEPRTPGGPPAGPDALVNDLTAGGNFRLRGLPQVAAAGDAMGADQDAGGDLSGTLPDPQVTGLQGLPVPQPQNGDVGRHLAVAQSGGSLVWRLVTPPAPGNGGGEPAGEAGLVRLRATSWMHNAPSDLTLRVEGLDNDAVPGIAVSFGIETDDDARVLIGRDEETQRFDRGSLDINSFRVYAELPDPRVPFPGTRMRIRLLPQSIVPIIPRIEFDGQTVFTEATLFPENAAPGAMLVFDRALLSEIVERNALVWVEIDGDHVLGRGPDRDDPLRAVDTEFLRSRLPSGDRPERADRGTQGGLFSSWINDASGRGFAAGGLDINRVDPGVLRALGMTPPQIRNFIGFRADTRGFDRTADAADAGLSQAARRILVESGLFYAGPR